MPGTARRWSRRDFLRTVGLAGAATYGVAGYAGYRPFAALGSVAPAAAPDVRVQRFASRPDLLPPAVIVTRDERRFSGAAGERMIFVAPKGYQTSAAPSRHGLMITDMFGRLVYFRPTTGTPMDLRPQTYRGRPVLTWWEGEVPDGYGKGRGYVMDTAYRVIATVRAGDGVDADLHEFLLTSRGTALLTAYRTIGADLSGVGGPARGTVYAGVVQEVDVASGKVLFTWSSLDHVDVTETFARRTPGRGTAAHPFDYFHVNGISEHPDGDLLVSARNTWTVYKVSRRDGRIMWRLGGRRSDFSQAPGAQFYWQHHVTAHGTGRISLFDNGASPEMEHASRGIVLDLDRSKSTATLARAYIHPDDVLAANQGSCQLLPDGALIGWGNQPGFSAFTTDGHLSLDARFPDGLQTYRAFTAPWTAHPSDHPALATHPSGPQTHLHASWNGSTEVTHWRALSGAQSDRLHPRTETPHTSFETTITVNSRGPYFAVEALNARGQTLARSRTVRTAGT